MSGQVYALASGKGGVGKTTVAVNLGVTLRADRHSVALVDADLGMSNLATLLGIDPSVTIHDVLAGEATVEEALTEEAPGFAVLPGDRDLAGFAAADPDGLGPVLETLAAEYDFVIADTGGGISYEDVLPLGVVDETVLVTTPDDAAVGDTAKTLELVHLLGGEVGGLVVNRAVEAADPAAIAVELGVSLLGAVPDDPAVTEAGRAGQPIKQYAPDSPATEAFGRLADALAAAAGDGTAQGQEQPAEPAGADGPADPEADATAADEWGTTPGEAGDGADADDSAAGSDSDPDEVADAADTPAAADGEAGASEPGSDAAGSSDAEPADPVDDAGSGDAGPEAEGDAAGTADGGAAAGDDPEVARAEGAEDGASSGGRFGWLSRIFG
jgi:septum site-determining protein MinD